MVCKIVAMLIIDLGHLSLLNKSMELDISEAFCKLICNHLLIQDI